MLAVAGMVTAGCGEGGEAGPPAEIDPAGECAVDPRSGALIGEILDREVDPESGEAAYRVRLEAAPGEVEHVGTGVRVVPCAEALAEFSEENPEPVFPRP